MPPERLEPADYLIFGWLVAGVLIAIARLFGAIDWPWWVVLAPMWVPIVGSLACVVVCDCDGGCHPSEGWQSVTFRALWVLRADPTTPSGFVEYEGCADAWGSGTSHDPAIYRSLCAGRQEILKRCLENPRPHDMPVFVSPELADMMIKSPEITAYLEHAPFTLEKLKGALGRNAIWGIPDALYWHPIHVSPEELERPRC